MPMPTEVLSDDQAALIWSGDTASIANLETKQEDQSKSDPKDDKTIDQKSSDEKKSDISEEDKKDVFIKSEELDNIFTDGDSDSEEDTTNTETTTEEKKVRGRKPVELVDFVNKLIDEDVLLGHTDPNDPDKILPISTIEEAKELIQANIAESKKEAKEEWWKEQIEDFSPQVQFVLEYARNGGKDLTSFMGAIARVEQTHSMDIENEEGQKEIVRQTLKIRGFDDDEISEEIETLVNLDRLKTKAEKFLPELKKKEQEQVSLMLREQEERKLAAIDASQKYLSNIESVLKKEEVGGIKLAKDDKRKIFDSLANARYTSLNGVPTNAFVKTLEELQFGNNANYDQFLNIVHYTVDPEGFEAKLAQKIANKVKSAEQTRLRSSKTSVANTEENMETTNTKKSIGVQKSSNFKNPFA